jgi:hypothetical protein
MEGATKESFQTDKQSKQRFQLTAKLLNANKSNGNITEVPA